MKTHSHKLLKTISMLFQALKTLIFKIKCYSILWKYMPYECKAFINSSWKELPSQVMEAFHFCIEGIKEGSKDKTCTSTWLNLLLHWPKKGLSCSHWSEHGSLLTQPLTLALIGLFSHSPWSNPSTISACICGQDPV